ncbi:hypothetical protein K1X76_00380 [bacterium]|nr:hypothetical protein [bacterium]
MIFQTATIAASKAITPLCQHIELNAPALVSSFTIPGQYAVIKAEGLKDGFFAMSSNPGDAPVSFLVKKASPTATHIAGLKVGDTLTISDAQGKGYALEKAQGKNVFLFAVGSAIAPIRSAVLYLLQQRAHYKGITLYYGALNGSEFAYEADFDTWESQGVKIITTVAPAPDKNWRGLTGFVQNHIPETPLGNDTIACVCGMPDMMKEVSAKLMSLGLPQENILTNY